jgi:hypothetical protein
MSLKDRDLAQSQLTNQRLQKRLGRLSETPGWDHSVIDVLEMGETEGVARAENVDMFNAGDASDLQSKTRQVEYGVLGTPCRISVHLEFEGFPIWLVALDSTLVDKVVIHGSASRQDFLQLGNKNGFSTDLLAASLDNLGRNVVQHSLSPTLSEGSLLLVSGSIAFVKKWTLQSPNPTLVVCTDHIRSKHMHGESSLRWSRFRHETFGGATQFQAMLGTNITEFAPSRTELRRSIRHILDYGLKPKWAKAPLLGRTAATLSLND